MCANSFFASVQVAKELLQWKLKLKVVIKNFHKDYTLELLETKLLNKRGVWYVLVSKNEEQLPTNLACEWLDKKEDILSVQLLLQILVIRWLAIS
jgi:hypothetical protein